MEWDIPVTQSVDWKVEREKVDLAAVATRLLGPAAKKRGGRLWWKCPFHEDGTPSFSVKADKGWWKCYGCDASGDAATLVMRLQNLTFPEAKEFLLDKVAPSRRPAAGPKPKAKVESPDPGPSGMTPGAAAELVEQAAARLWTPEGAESLAYLTGPARRLTPETVRAARLGWSPSVQARTKDGRPYSPRGIVIPWFTGGVVTLIKVRQPAGRKPKYAEVYRDAGRHGGIYPGPESVRPGRPMIAVEGEFDGLCLAQRLGDLAAVITRGSASDAPSPATLRRLLSASPWFVATDADAAGDKAAGCWPASARRIRPPGPHKDWTEADAAGVGLRRWWLEILAGADRPALYTWDDLSGWRWGPAAGDGDPGVDNPGGRPFDPETFARAMDQAVDPYVTGELAAATAL